MAVSVCAHFNFKCRIVLHQRYYPVQFDEGLGAEIPFIKVEEYVVQSYDLADLDRYEIKILMNFFIAFFHQ